MTTKGAETMTNAGKKTVTIGNRTYSITTGIGVGGWYAEVYTDNDGASGYGDNPMVGHWYGTLDECLRVDPRDVKLHAPNYNEPVDPFDLAHERRFD